MTTRIMIGDVREQLRLLPDSSVHCVVTSPPYFGLRSYLPDDHPDKAKEIGLEPTFEAFISALVEVFREVRRVLRDDGTLWLNLGDSYAGSWGAQGHRESSTNEQAISRNQIANHPKRAQHTGTIRQAGLKPKDLIGIPWRVALALQADGWYLRQDIIWSKPNPMPESVTDRCTKAHEYVFLLSKSERYFYDADAIAEPLAYGSAERLSQDVGGQEGSDRVPGKTNGKMKAVYKERYTGQSTKDFASGKAQDASATKQRIVDRILSGELITRNKRSVWTVTTQPYKGAHFATFPAALIEPMILAGCPARCCAECGAPWQRQVERVDQGFDGSKYGEAAVAASGGAITGGTAKSTLGSPNGKMVGQRETIGFAASCECNVNEIPGTVLDPFGGSGTTALVADRLQRDSILIELNPDGSNMIRDRLNADASLFAEVAE